MNLTSKKTGATISGRMVYSHKDESAWNSTALLASFPYNSRSPFCFLWHNVFTLLHRFPNLVLQYPLSCTYYCCPCSQHTWFDQLVTSSWVEVGVVEQAKHWIGCTPGPGLGWVVSYYPTYRLKVVWLALAKWIGLSNSIDMCRSIISFCLSWNLLHMNFQASFENISTTW